MLRRMIGTLFALGVLMGAAGRCEAVQTGNVRVELKTAEQVVSSGAVTLYRAGASVSGGYRLDADFGGGFVAWEDVDSQALAQWLAEQAKEEGRTLLLDADGCADFSGLTEGLYLVVQTEAVEGYCTMDPFLTKLPREEAWSAECVQTLERTWEEPPKTGQHPAPILGAMGLVLSGMGLVILAEGRQKRR